MLNKIAFDRNNIQIGIPQQIWLENPNGKMHNTNIVD
jgi:hypothetical protein